MSLIAELQRRNVFRVAAAYLALGWVVAQVTELMIAALNLPASVLAIVVWIGVAGFPFVLIFSWAFEMTPEGLKRERDVDRSASITNVTGKRLDYITIGIVAVAIVLLAVDRFVPRASVGAGPAREQAEADRAQGALLPGQADANRAQGALPQESALSPATDKSIAVLPFVNMSEEKSNEYFSDGISEELLNLLAKIPELRVIARTSSFAFKGKEADIGEIAAKLKVAHILEGSVRKSGNKVRITAQLIRTADSTHLWSETYDRSLDDIFAVQEEIARVVVEQLKIALLGAAPKVREVDPKAYAMYLQARALGRQYTPEGYEQSNALLKQVLGIDPNYAPAWRVLAVNYSNQALDGLMPAAEAIRLAGEAVQKALAADPNFAAAYSTLGNNRMYNHDFAGAAREMQHALELDPSDLTIATNAANLLAAIGRTEQSVAVTEYVAARDPVNTVAYGNLGSNYLAAGRLDESIAANQTALHLSPGYIGSEQALGVALLLKGDKQAALAAMQRESGEAQRLGGLAVAQHALGNAAASDAALAELIAKFAVGQSVIAAGALAYRGDLDQSFAWLEKGRDAREPQLTGILADPLLDSLHADPRWSELLRSMGLAPEQVAAIKLEVKLPKPGA